MNKRVRAVAVALSLMLPGGPAGALGTASYSSELISVRSLGQGGTGVAGVHDDPVAVYTNPAAMTDLKGTQAYAGLAYVNGRPTFTDGAGRTQGARATSVPVPSFAATTRFLDGALAAGLAAVVPYGLETHWNGDSAVRYAATDARLRVVDITSSLAYKLNDAFSIGAGVDHYRAVQGTLERKLDTAQVNGDLVFAGTGNAALAGAAAAASTDSNARLDGTGGGWGYHIGTTIAPNERHRIGVVYHSMAAITLKGKVQLTDLNGPAVAALGGTSLVVDAEAPLYIPQNVQVGYAYRPDERWTFEADAAWYDWYAARRLGIVYKGTLTAAQSAVLQANNPQVFNPRKTINFGLGANYKRGDALQLRAGAYYQAAALPESTFNPSFLDLPRYAVTAGAGFALSKTIGLDLAYNAILFRTRHITSAGSTDPFARNRGFSGSFTSWAHVLAASLTCRIGS